MNAASQSLGNEINPTPSSLANEVRRSSLLASGNIVGGAGTVNVHTQSVPIDMKAGLNNNNNNNSAMTAIHTHEADCGNRQTLPFFDLLLEAPDAPVAIDSHVPGYSLV